jgi:hypothetical protein
VSAAPLSSVSGKRTRACRIGVILGVILFCSGGMAYLSKPHSPVLLTNINDFRLDLPLAFPSDSVIDRVSVHPSVETPSDVVISYRVMSREPKEGVLRFFSSFYGDALRHEVWPGQPAVVCRAVDRHRMRFRIGESAGNGSIIWGQVQVPRNEVFQSGRGLIRLSIAEERPKLWWSWLIR